MIRHVEPRSAQALPSEIVGDLLQAIRGQFYGDLLEEEFHEQRRFLTRVVTWPAARLTRQGVTLPPARYKAIFLDILDGIKTHGAAAVRGALLAGVFVALRSGALAAPWR